MTVLRGDRLSMGESRAVPPREEEDVSRVQLWLLYERIQLRLCEVSHGWWHRVVALVTARDHTESTIPWASVSQLHTHCQQLIAHPTIQNRATVQAVLPLLSPLLHAVCVLGLLLANEQRRMVKTVPNPSNSIRLA